MRLHPPEAPEGFVALLTEGVGRNGSALSAVIRSSRSPSSRRAWVEIPRPAVPAPGSSVALLTEGVGRNCNRLLKVQISATVALLTEGVGRNLHGFTSLLCLIGRPPHGGRG